MLNLRASASGVCRQLHGVGAVRVHHGAQALRPGLAACGIELRRRQVGDPAKPDTRRGEDLHDVGARRRSPADELADSVRGTGVLRHRAER